MASPEAEAAGDGMVPRPQGMTADSLPGSLHSREDAEVAAQLHAPQQAQPDGSPRRALSRVSFNAGIDDTGAPRSASRTGFAGIASSNSMPLRQIAGS